MLFVILALIHLFLLAMLVAVLFFRDLADRLVGEHVLPVMSSEKYIYAALRKHFRTKAPNDVTIISREFPIMWQIEVFREIQNIFEGKKVDRLQSVELGYGETRLHSCFIDNNREFTAVKYDEIDIGEEKPVLSANNLIYFWHEQAVPMVLLMIVVEGMPSKMSVDVAVPKGSKAEADVELLMNRITESVKDCPSYRHKIVAFGQTGSGIDILVQQIRHVVREQLILPEKTIRLLERNLFHFSARRQQLKDRGLPTKKGLLFYGPPGTGKTHTLHYIIGQLKEKYTTFLVPAQQTDKLSVYFQLARQIEPALIILEDADIVARERGTGGSEEALNTLLNEMDGLQEDSDVIVLLTTNRPDELEDAIRNRPGRIDQAIEFPKPDKESRIKLAQLYSGGVELTEQEAEAMAARTEGASAAFMKELLRRSIQFMLERDETAVAFAAADWENALQEMLTGSSFGVMRLGDESKFVL